MSRKRQPQQHPQRELYFDHGDPHPDLSERERALAELEAESPITPPRRRPVGRDDDLGFESSAVKYLVNYMI